MHNPRWLAVFFGIGLNCDSPILEALLIVLSSRTGDEIWRKLIEIGFNENTPEKELDEILRQCNWVQVSSPSKSKIVLQSKTFPRNQIQIQTQSNFYYLYLERILSPIDEQCSYAVEIDFANRLENETAFIYRQNDVNDSMEQCEILWESLDAGHSIPRTLCYMHSLSRFLNGQSTQINCPRDAHRHSSHDYFGFFTKPTFIEC